MLKGLSGILEKSKNLKLPVLNGKKPNQKKTTEPETPKAKEPTPSAVVLTPATTSVAVEPKGVSKVVNGRVEIWTASEDKAKTAATKYRDALAGTSKTEAVSESLSIENADLLIAAAYKQVFGNAYLMESERCIKAESQVRSGDISVLEFIRQLAKSDRYRALFWEKHPNVTAIELNFKHLLGRAPESYAEISEHIKIIADGGFEAEIDSYLDSDEYLQNFGDMFVPYSRGYDTQTGRNSVGFSRSFSLFGAACGSDKSRFGGDNPGLKSNLLADAPGDIPAIRAIPDSYPEELGKGSSPRVPKELYGIARSLLAERAARKGTPIANY
ncbi:MAG: phycobilisome rod-core linker polypeptide [Cyanobacteria bacterium P01_A01_bin.137]